MAEPNIRQKIYVIDINAQTEQTLKNYLLQGYVLHQMVPIIIGTVNKLILVYYDPAVDQEP